VTPSSSGLRVRHLRKAGRDWFMLFNEAVSEIDAAIEIDIPGTLWLVEPYENQITRFDGRLRLPGHGLRVLVCESEMNDGNQP
jgi:hypothetical protein